MNKYIHTNVYIYMYMGVHGCAKFHLIFKINLQRIYHPHLIDKERSLEPRLP